MLRHPALATTLVALLTCAGVAPTLAAASSPAEPDTTTRRWSSLRGWAELPAQPSSAPTEQWASGDALDDFIVWRTITLGTRLVLLQEAGGDLDVRGVDLTSGRVLWSTVVELSDDHTDRDLLGSVFEVGTDAILIGAFRDDLVSADGPSPADTATAGTAAPDSKPAYVSAVVDVATGTVLWHDIDENRDDCCTDVALTADVVVIDGEATDRQTGERLWAGGGDYTGVGDTLLMASGFGDDDPGFGAVDPATGRPVWWEDADDDGRVNRRVHLADDTVLHMRDGDDPIIEGYDLVSGSSLWTLRFAELPESLHEHSITVTALGDGLALLDNSDAWSVNGFERDGAAVVDLRSGTVLWSVDDGVAIGPSLDHGGQPLVLRSDDTVYSVLDGRSGEPLTTLPCPNDDPFAPITPVDGGVLCTTARREGDEVLGYSTAMIGFDGTERWRVDLDGRERVIAPIPGGFVTGRQPADGTAQLVGYTG